MNMKKDIQLIWDFDDTIVQTNVEFEKTNQETAEVIAKAVYGKIIDVERIKTYQRKLDVEMVVIYGFIPPRYLMSWLATYEHFAREAKLAVNPVTKELIEATINNLYIRQYENIPQSISVMKQLKQEGYSMIVLTAGQDEIQKRKVRESGAIDFVDEVLVYPRKTPETLQEVMEKFPAVHHAMIGNSLKSDIFPALENNAWGFHFERDTWEADNYDIDRGHEKYIHIPCLSDIPKHVKRILSQTFLVG
jgi:putative hydrolase of the HAD superfamily